MYKKILFATTASPVCDNAAKVAFDMSGKYDADLYVFHVLGVPTRGFSPFVTDVRTGDEEETHDANYIDLVKEEIANTYDKLLEVCDKCHVEAVVGVPHREILRKARQEDADLIVMGANSRQEEVGASRYRAVAGSTMRKVAKAARCPVVIISRPCTTCWKLFSNIVFATDFSKAAESAFQYAMKSAMAVGAKLYLFHAVDVPTSGGLPPSQEEVEARVAEARKKMKEKYLYQLKENNYENYEVAIWEGTPYVEILKYARDKQADLIVMAHHTKDVDPEEAELGSTVEQVVLRSACPVASVNHPDRVAEMDID